MAVPPKASPHQVRIATVIILVSICCTGAARQKINNPRGPLNSANPYSDIVFETSQRTISPGDSNLHKISLGRTLYFDKRLSVDGTVSCATCHDPAVAFASTDALAIGAGNRIGARNAPTILNAKFSSSYFWDGRARTLEEQAKQPLLNPSEMGMKSEAELVRRVSEIDEYRMRFRQVFPRQGITLNTIAGAIAAFERTLVSMDSPFDRFIAGDVNAINENQKLGWQLFKGKARCIECHTISPDSPLFTDFKFYNTGIAAGGTSFENLAERVRGLSKRGVPSDRGDLAHDPELSDLGRFLVTHRPADIGAFKTPPLRDVELTGPYMHDGSIKTLLEVIRFYNQGGSKNQYLDEKMKPLELTDAEMGHLVEFLRALTSKSVLRMVQSTLPQSRQPVPLPNGQHNQPGCWQ